METKRIAELLDKYYRGETTLEEERQLKSFFQQEEAPEELQADKDVFLLYTGLVQQPVDLPEGLEERLSASIGRWQQESQRRRPWLRPSIRRWSIGIAASLLIAAGMGIYLQKSEPKQHDTFTNPALAYQETQRALQLFATALQKGEAQMVKAEKTTLKVQQTLENITTPAGKKQ